MRRLLLPLFLLLAACPKPPPGPGEPHPQPVNCIPGMIAACAPVVIPLINECLAGAGDVVPCVLGITKVAGCATYEILACVVRARGGEAARSAQANPADTRDARMADRAKEYLERTGATFAPQVD
jgi:hypothetical protein